MSCGRFRDGRLALSGLGSGRHLAATVRGIALSSCRQGGLGSDLLSDQSDWPYAGSIVLVLVFRAAPFLFSSPLGFPKGISDISPYPT